MTKLMKDQLANGVVCIEVLVIANDNRATRRLRGVSIVASCDRKTDLARRGEPDLIDCIAIVVIA